ncbi:MAG: COQ9 family protein [Magnetovibrio sp.]|nr:COQ9 family protein [Magnetovibrio sp.]
MNNSFYQRDLIVESALKHVPMFGWTWKALDRGSKDLTDDAMLARRLFSCELSAAADHFADWSDRRMRNELGKLDLSSMRVRDRIHTCVKIRIILNSTHKEAVRRFLAYLVLPHNTGLATRLSWRSCSEIWYAIGDRSADWNYYSKRAILVSVYTSTIMYWLSDEGNCLGDYPDTWSFLDRRIDNVLSTFGLFGRLGKRLSKLPGPIIQRVQKAP